MSKSWTCSFVAAVLAVWCSTAVFAQQPQAQSPANAQQQARAAEDEEEVFDSKLREFGYWSGAAFSCVADARQVEVERKVIETFSGIARLFGTDRAFIYAAAFGNGTTHKVEAAKCPEFLDRFEKAAALRGGRK